MPSQIDPTRPIDGAPAIKADLRANLQSAKDEIEALQTGKTDFGHQHVLADVTDSGALASKNIVQSDDIATAAITTEKLAAAAVGGTELADAVVTTLKLADGAITSEKLAAASVTVGKIAAAAVGTAELADNAVTTAKLAHGTADTLVGFDASGTPGEVAAGARVTISGGMIAVVPGSLSDLTDAPTSYLAQGGRFLRANVGETAVEFALIGANAIADGAVSSAKLADSAVSAAKIGPDAVGSANIAAAAVTSAKVADGAVATAKLANAAVTSPKIASNAVDSAKIAAAAVTGDKIAAGVVTGDKIAGGAVSTTKLADGAVTGDKIAADGAAAILTNWLHRNWAEMVLIPPISAGSGGGGITVAGSDQNEGTSVSAMVALPAHQTNDELFILFGWADHIRTLTPPSGWSLVPTSPLGGVNHKGVTARLRAASAGTTNPVFTLSASDQWQYKVVVLRGVNATRDDAAPQSSTSTTTSGAAPSVTTVTANAMVICACTVNAPDSMPSTPEIIVPSGFTKVETAAEHAGSGLATALAYKNQASAGSSGGPHTFTWGGASEEVNVWTFAYKPAGAAATVQLNYAAGHYQVLDLSTANLGTGIDTLIVTAISNPPAGGRHGALQLKIKQDPSVGGRSVDFGSLNPRYQGASPPIFSDTPGGIDKLFLETDDGGATWEITSATPFQA
jgi:hypothetical protein